MDFVEDLAGLVRSEAEAGEWRMKSEERTLCRIAQASTRITGFLAACRDFRTTFTT